MADESNPKNGYRVVEWFRFITPVLVTVAITMVGSLRMDIKSIEDKMFKHFTNEELHMPRARIASKGEFDLYREYTDKQITALVAAIGKMEDNIIKKLDRK